MKQNKYQEALALALSFYEGKAKAVVGLTGSQKQRKDIVAHLVSVECSVNMENYSDRVF